MNNFTLIHLDASAKSTMQWQDSKKAALSALASGKKILWHIDLGLFQHLSMPLSNTSQFMTLRLALDHFRDTIWDEFHKYSLGATIYRGSPDFSLQMNWNDDERQNFIGWKSENGLENESDLFYEKLYFRDVGSSYLTQVVANVPDRIPLYICFDDSVSDPLTHFILTSKELFSRFNILENKQTEQAPVAICWPSAEKRSLHYFKDIGIAIEMLFKEEIPFRIIPENNLTIEWHGLDHLIYAPTSMTVSGIRKLKGFHAAGGTLITLGDPLDFDNEVTLNSFLSSFIKNKV